jgi:hypothetical protein
MKTMKRKEIYNVHIAASCSLTLTIPWFNLAVEECIFRQMPATQRVLFLAQCRYGGNVIQFTHDN